MPKSNIGKYNEIVKEALIKYPKTRDDSGLLYVATISLINGLDYVKEISLYDHFRGPHKELPTISSIVRLSTKIQSENVHLRGINWKERQKHSKDYKEDLGYGRN